MCVCPKSLPRVTARNMSVHLLAILTCFSNICELNSCAKHSSNVNQWIYVVQTHDINQIHACVMLIFGTLHLHG